MAKARPSRLRPQVRLYAHNALPGAEPACKDLSRNGQERAITSQAAYTPVSKRAGSRSAHHNAFAVAAICV